MTLTHTRTHAPTRSTHRSPQTLAQARAEYRKHGPRISSQEQRQLERGAELWRRAEKIKLAEMKRKQAKERKAAKEEREREARGKLGIPKCRVAASQKLLEGFVKVEVEKKYEDVKEEENEVEMFGGDAVGMLVTGSSEEDIWSDGGLDDGALLDAASSIGGYPAHRQVTAVINGAHATSGPCGHNRSENNNTAVDPPDMWDEFLLLSNTQVEREIASEPTTQPPPPSPPLQSCMHDPFSALLSTQDFLSATDGVPEFRAPAGPVLSKGIAKRSKPERKVAGNHSDALLMPPPPRPVMLKQTMVGAAPCSTVVDIVPLDFGLSTQDLGDFGG